MLPVKKHAQFQRERFKTVGIRTVSETICLFAYLKLLQFAENWSDSDFFKLDLLSKENKTQAITRFVKFSIGCIQ